MIINEAIFRGLFNDVILNSGICLRRYFPDKTFYRQLTIMYVCVSGTKKLLLLENITSRKL